MIAFLKVPLISRFVTPNVYVSMERDTSEIWAAPTTTTIVLTTTTTTATTITTTTITGDATITIAITNAIINTANPWALFIDNRNRVLLLIRNGVHQRDIARPDQLKV